MNVLVLCWAHMSSSSIPYLYPLFDYYYYYYHDRNERANSTKLIPSHSNVVAICYTIAHSVFQYSVCIVPVNQPPFSDGDFRFYYAVFLSLLLFNFNIKCKVPNGFSNFVAKSEQSRVMEIKFVTIMFSKLRMSTKYARNGNIYWTLWALSVSFSLKIMQNKS